MNHRAHRDHREEEKGIIEKGEAEWRGGLSRWRRQETEKLSHCPVDLLINFNVKLLRSGIRRIIHDT